MKEIIKPIGEETIADMFSPCRGCVYWEAPEKCGHIPQDEAFKLKQEWFRRVTIAFGDCGKLLYVNGVAVAYAQYCHPHLFGNVSEYQRVLHGSKDAILISCLYVRSKYRGEALGTKLLHAVLQDVRERKFESVETYSRDDTSNNCSGPTAFYLKNGFEVVNRNKWGNATFSLVRLRLK